MKEDFKDNEFIVQSFKTSVKVPTLHINISLSLSIKSNNQELRLINDCRTFVVRQSYDSVGVLSNFANFP